MVDPVWIIAAGLGAAFLMPLAEKAGRPVMRLLLFLALAFMTYVPVRWFIEIYFCRAEAAMVYTAGFKPPFSIVLRMGAEEAALAGSAGLLSILGAVYMGRQLGKGGTAAHSLYLLFVMGMAGMFMTRDLFNLFVFLEVVSISSYALIAMEGSLKSISAALKYALAGGVATVFLLIGIIFVYREGGSLDVDLLAASGASAAVPVAAFMLIFAFLIESKQFPANGWALDVYEAADPGFSAMISAGSTGAVLYALMKLVPVSGEAWYGVLAIAGVATFVLSNLMGLKQTNVRRMLGYSSAAQTGLLIFAVGIGRVTGIAGNIWGLILVALFFNHFLAKAGLYWLAGIVGRDDIKDWKLIAGRPLLIALMGLFVLSLVGIPPMAGFWGKYALIMRLHGYGAWLFRGLILLGSLLEAAYLLRWFGYAVGAGEENGERIRAGFTKLFPPVVFALLTVAASYYLTTRSLGGARPLFVFVLLAGLALFALGRLPDLLKGLLSIGAVGALAYYLFPSTAGFSQFFSGAFLVGGGVIMIASMSRKAYSYGFHSLAVILIGSLACLTVARGPAEFFICWELMTVSSYLLIIKGRKAGIAALMYILFSLGSAYLLLAGFAAGKPVGTGWAGFSVGWEGFSWNITALYLLAGAFLVKAAAIGVHIWAPGSYAEAEDEASPLLSGVLSKVGVFGLIVALSAATAAGLDTERLTTIIGWIGALTALFGALYACFQEDMKRLVAWSSIGQVGYIVMGLAAMNNIGWTAALWHTVAHLMFGAMLFLAVAGVIRRTGTRNMYETGGLIKKMPATFISVLIAIIALSGVPPLTGFAGKWMLYQAMIERGWYFQAGTAFFASAIAFLYCFRLIHAVFLGQLKPKHAEVRRAPILLLIPQYIFIMGIMLFATFPGRLIKPASALAAELFPSPFVWEGFSVSTPLGYLNGTVLMLLVCALFGLMFIFLLLWGPRPKKVGQLNIVFAAERPESPETTHYAYNFFEPYRRAVSPVLRPLVKNFWNGISEWTVTLGAILRHIYTGNAQTYLLFILIYGVILFFVSGGTL
jgi:formate hydrogenlyase subunit 3/multisubunit Na+/H+ antiporter MnhD subunit